MYEEIATSKKKSYHTIKRTAECYRFMDDNLKSAEWYRNVVNNEDVIAKDYYDYAQVLKKTGNYTVADENLEIYISKFVSLQVADPEFYDSLIEDSANYKVSSLSFNT